MSDRGQTFGAPLVGADEQDFFMLLHVLGFFGVVT
jgi:hypothetical protein